MAQFSYSALDAQGNTRDGTIDAVNIDIAIGALQRRGLIVSAINPVESAHSFRDRIPFIDRITNADIVLVSRQITTLFEAQVSALRAFRLLASEARTPQLAARLSEIANDIQSGSSISAALSSHPEIFSQFYVNMVRAGEETGKLDETFSFLADYLDRNYEITQKARNALVYPAFIIFTFVVVMILMLTLVIPRLAEMLTEVGQQIPIYTRVVIGLSEFLRHYFLLLSILFAIGTGVLIRYIRTPAGRLVFSQARLQTPAIGPIFKKIFLSRIADNLSTMLKSGIQVLRGLEITASVVEDPVYEAVILETAADVKGGMPMSEAFRKHPEIPGIIVAMIKIGEETGNMASILEVMARYYRREVNNAVDTLVELIEPLIIVLLAVGVAVLLASVLVPIYNIASSF
ncbi:MAG: type II secretion system F family protein [bacterium]|nr:type II secretion system F family protein [bacterium]